MIDFTLNFLWYKLFKGTFKNPLLIFEEQIFKLA